jgi:hypothetical protein
VRAPLFLTSTISLALSFPSYWPSELLNQMDATGRALPCQSWFVVVVDFLRFAPMGTAA